MARFGAASRKEQTAALVLRRHDYGDADRMLILLTPLRGKVRVAVRGVRSPRARRAALTEPASELDLVLAHGRGCPVLSEGRVVRGTHGLCSNMGRLTQALHILELLDLAVDEGQEAPDIYALACEALTALEKASSPQLLARGFEMRLLRLMGLSPSLLLCARDEQTIPAQAARFSARAGGVLCADCSASGEGILLDSRTLLALQRLEEHPLEKLASASPPDGVVRLLERTMLGYLRWVLESPLRAAAMAGELSRGAGAPAAAVEDQQ